MSGTLAALHRHQIYYGPDGQYARTTLTPQGYNAGPEGNAQKYDKQLNADWAQRCLCCRQCPECSACCTAASTSRRRRMGGDSGAGRLRS